MDDYIQALRSKDETPGSLLTMTKEAEAAILDKYRADVTAKQEGMECLYQIYFLFTFLQLCKCGGSSTQLDLRLIQATGNWLHLYFLEKVFSYYS